MPVVGLVTAWLHGLQMRHVGPLPLGHGFILRARDCKCAGASPALVKVERKYQRPATPWRRALNNRGSSLACRRIAGYSVCHFSSCLGVHLSLSLRLGARAARSPAPAADAHEYTVSRLLSTTVSINSGPTKWLRLAVRVGNCHEHRAGAPRACMRLATPPQRIQQYR